MANTPTSNTLALANTAKPRGPIATSFLQLLLLLGIATLPSFAFALDVSHLYTFNGDSGGDQFGLSVSAAGDVNNDGYADVIVGAPYDDNNGSNSGSAQIFSGANNSILYTFNGDSAEDRFGYSVSTAGDVNNDGFADVIVGAYSDDNTGTDSGSARVFSGANGSILYTFNGDGAGDNFGYAVSAAGDINNDGFDDVLVGAYGDDNTAADSGSARVFSGLNGNILYTFNGDSASDLFGLAVSAAGDVNNDGFADVVVGAYLDDNTASNAGSARVFSGANGDILYTFNGDGAGDHFGVSVSAAGDVNNDGFADVIVGARYDDNTGTDSGSARIFSGINGNILYTFNGDSAGDYFGFSVSAAGDVNNDNYDDVIVGALYDDNNGSNSGSARVFSGANGSVIYTFNGDSAGDNFGQSVSTAGDVNNDGFEDFIVGAYLEDNNNKSDSGSARIFSGAALVSDWDADGLSDVLDADDDNDSVPDVTDTYPFDASRSAADSGILYNFNGDYLAQFGASVSAAGDVNNDGYADVIVGAPYDRVNGNLYSSGSAWVLSGVNGSSIYTFNGDGSGDDFGSSVSNAGDVNNDGYPDVIVGAPGDKNNGYKSDSTKVLSGATGSLLYAFNGDSGDELFGYSVSNAGDVNNDGYADVIVGAPYAANNGANSGSARVFSGTNGSILYTFNGNFYDYFASSVSDAGDVNNDGYADVIIGGGGRAQVFSGVNGAILYTFTGLGQSVSAAGDVNNDSFDDVIISDASGDNNGNDPGCGSVHIMSGATGATLYTFYGDNAGDKFGFSASAAGDVNNDGFVDVIVGTPYDDNNGRTDSGSVRVFSGANGSILYTFNGDSANDWFGWSVSNAGDVNNDGFADVIVGARRDDNNGGDSGSARIFSGKAFITDFDNDGTNDNADVDDDNDGVLDINDSQPQNPAITNDLDTDGINASADNCPSNANADQLNTDGDTQGNACDDDDDNDGVADTSDKFPLNVAASSDADADGFPGGWNATSTCDTTCRSNSGLVLDNCPSNANADQLDTDGDGQGNACDTDDDDDGVADTSDKFPLNVAASSDADVDGFPSSWNAACNATCQSNSGLVLDNCPSNANADQLNTDGDTQGNVCDNDDDNDGMPDVNDAFPLNAAETLDTDFDGTGNNADTDDDNDGLPDGMDPLPLQAKFNLNAPYKGSQIGDQNAVP